MAESSPGAFHPFPRSKPSIKTDVDNADVHDSAPVPTHSEKSRAVSPTALQLNTVNIDEQKAERLARSCQKGPRDH